VRACYFRNSYVSGQKYTETRTHITILYSPPGIKYWMLKHQNSILYFRSCIAQKPVLHRTICWPVSKPSLYHSLHNLISKPFARSVSVIFDGSQS